MSKHGESIVFVEDNSRFQLQQNKNWFRPLERIYQNEKGDKVVYTTIKHKVYVIDVTTKKNKQTDLLMALSLHQLLEAEARKKASQDLFSDLY